MPDDGFDITIPVERGRYEDRIPIGHTSSQWKFRQEEFHYRCAYCGIHKRATVQRYLVRDHVQPVSREGTDLIHNVVPSCWDCNERKGRSMPGEVSKAGWLVPEPRPRKRKVRCV